MSSPSDRTMALRSLSDSTQQLHSALLSVTKPAIGGHGLEESDLPRRSTASPTSPHSPPYSPKLEQAWKELESANERLRQANIPQGAIHAHKVRPKTRDAQGLGVERVDNVLVPKGHDPYSPPPPEKSPFSEFLQQTSIEARALAHNLDQAGRQYTMHQGALDQEGEVMLHVDRARHLNAQSQWFRLKSHVSAYCVMKFGDLEYRTRTVGASEHPVWDELFVLPVPNWHVETWPYASFIRFTVCDENQKNSEIGSFSIHVADLMQCMGEARRFTISLTDREGRERGEIDIAATAKPARVWKPTTDTLKEVPIEKAFAPIAYEFSRSNGGGGTGGGGLPPSLDGRFRSLSEATPPSNTTSSADATAAHQDPGSPWTRFTRRLSTMLSPRNSPRQSTTKQPVRHLKDGNVVPPIQIPDSRPQSLDMRHPQQYVSQQPNRRSLDAFSLPPAIDKSVAIERSLTLTSMGTVTDGRNLSAFTQAANGERV